MTENLWSIYFNWQRVFLISCSLLCILSEFSLIPRGKIIDNINRERKSFTRLKHGAKVKLSSFRVTMRSRDSSMLQRKLYMFHSTRNQDSVYQKNCRYKSFQLLVHIAKYGPRSRHCSCRRNSCYSHSFRRNLQRDRAFRLEQRWVELLEWVWATQSGVGEYLESWMD